MFISLYWSCPCLLSSCVLCFWQFHSTSEFSINLLHCIILFKFSFSFFYCFYFLTSLLCGCWSSLSMPLIIHFSPFLFPQFSDLTSTVIHKKRIYEEKRKYCLFLWLASELFFLIIKVLKHHWNFDKFLISKIIYQDSLVMKWMKLLIFVVVIFYCLLPFPEYGIGDR